jgi:hypothetical protein
MKQDFFCMECFTKNPSSVVTFAGVELRDDGIYEFTCPSGHITTTILQEQKFEVLFEMGANTIIDGYNPAAVSSFAASLERFGEFYIKVISLKHGVAEKEFNDSWKYISNQSERQLGAFIFLYTIENKKLPTLLSNTQIKFRNKVIHKGYIPEKKEAIDFGNAVLQIIRPILQDLKIHYKDQVKTARVNHLIIKSRKCLEEPKDTISTRSTPTIINIASGESERNYKPLDELLTKLENRRKGVLWSGSLKKS